MHMTACECIRTTACDFGAGMHVEKKDINTKASQHRLDRHHRCVLIPIIHVDADTHARFIESTITSCVARHHNYWFR